MTKYNARKVKEDGYTFDSKAEYSRYRDLKLLQAAGEISGLIVHPKFKIMDAFEQRGKKYLAAHYIADFEYLEEPDGNVPVVEDVKGKQTDLSKLKIKMFLYRYGDAYDFRLVKV